MTVRIDGRGSCQDVYFPTVGLHSTSVSGDLPCRAGLTSALIVGGLAIRCCGSIGSLSDSPGRSSSITSATNLLVTELIEAGAGPRNLDHRPGGDGLCGPAADGRNESPGQYLKRFRIINDGTEDFDALFGLFVRTEINGVGEPGLSWHDGVRALLATNRGHGHVDRKLARDSTVEFAIAMDHQGPVECEPTGDKEAPSVFGPPAGRAVRDGRRARQRGIHGLAGRPGHVPALARPGWSGSVG